MIFESFNPERSLKKEERSYDLIVIGGGLTGVCCALTAAREGIKVCLVQDRPVLGGNSSSEVRVWALGATSHQGNNNRWSREGGVIDEILTENLWRNKEGNPHLFDMLLIDKVLAEKNITLMLNTIVFDIRKSSASRIRSVLALNASSETMYELSAGLFADCSGDGIVSYLAGVPYRMGAEEKEVYGEGFAPDPEKYGELMGDTIFFYMKDTGRKVEYKAPSFALKDAGKYISKIHNPEYFNTGHHGCKYWWLEYGGKCDTVHDTEKIKLELWKVVYGIWNHIKNSGAHPEMDTWTLEWVGVIPGKRESRRFKGMYTLTQQDIVEQTSFHDTVSYGGWAVDLHPAKGVYAPGRACNQWHSKGIYEIPFRCFVSKDVENLMFGGRIASSSHVANGSMRVMCTCAHGGQAIGMAAALCTVYGHVPAYYTEAGNVKELQHALEARGQFIPGFEEADKNNLLNSASLTSSRPFLFRGFRHDAGFMPLEFSTALLLPVRKGNVPGISIPVEATEATELTVELRTSSKVRNFTPDVTLETVRIPLEAGASTVSWSFRHVIDCDRYVFVCLMRNPHVKAGCSCELAPGIMTVYNHINPAVSNYGRQDAPEGTGFESFEFWCPKRRPAARNLAVTLKQPLDIYGTDNLRNILKRPLRQPDCWACDDAEAAVELTWKHEVEIKEITLFFDTDTDHAMETVQMGHTENVMPQCVRSYRIYEGSGRPVYVKTENHQAVNHMILDRPVRTSRLRIEMDRPESCPASLYHMIIK